MSQKKIVAVIRRLLTQEEVSGEPLGKVTPERPRVPKVTKGFLIPKDVPNDLSTDKQNGTVSEGNAGSNRDPKRCPWAGVPQQSKKSNNYHKS
jgi:hypothetical protein